MKIQSTILSKIAILTVLFVFFISLAPNISKSEIPDYLQNEFNGIYETKHNHNQIQCSHFENLQKNKSNNLKLDGKINQLQKIDPAPTNYDVLMYDLYLDWSSLMNPDSVNLNRRNFTGVMKMTVLITENNVDSLEFNSEAMNIIYTKVNNVNTNIKYGTTVYLNEANVVFLDKKYNIGDTLIIEIAYEHKGNQQLGLFFYTKETPGVLETIAYTMSEPELARIWMPCKDRPDDKALSKITIKVPKGFDAVSNGLLIDKIEDLNTTTFVWDNDIPIPTYLMHVISSKYFKWEDYYKPKNNPNDSIEVSYYAWEQDMPEFNANSIYLPRPSMSKTVEMIGYLSNIFVEYPYQKYSQTAAFPFPYGGMEHQTATTIHRNWLKNGSEIGVVHEIGHHWLGDMISCATWNDVWINEGGATWVEMLWTQNKGDTNAYNSYVSYFSSQYFGQVPHIHNQAIYGIPQNEIFNNNNVYLVYIKAGLVYNMLYKMLGEEFLVGLRNTFEDYKFKSLTTEQFKESLKKYIKNPPVDLDVFFEQWFMKPAHPFLQLDSYFELVNGKYNLTVKLNQTQKETLKSNEVTEVFQMPIIFNINTDGGIIEKKVILDKKSQQYIFELDNEPLDINIDLTAILARVTKNPMGVDNKTINEKNGLSVFPNPAISGENIHLKMYHLKSETEFTEKSYILINSYEIYDLNGKLIEANNNVFSAETMINTTNIDAGIYVIRVNTPNKTIISKFTVIK